MLRNSLPLNSRSVLVSVANIQPWLMFNDRFVNPLFAVWVNVCYLSVWVVSYGEFLLTVVTWIHGWNPLDLAYDMKFFYVKKWVVSPVAFLISGVCGRSSFDGLAPRCEMASFSLIIRWTPSWVVFTIGNKPSSYSDLFPHLCCGVSVWNLSDSLGKCGWWQRLGSYSADGTLLSRPTGSVKSGVPVLVSCVCEIWSDKGASHPCVYLSQVTLQMLSFSQDALCEWCWQDRVTSAPRLGSRSDKPQDFLQGQESLGRCWGSISYSMGEGGNYGYFGGPLNEGEPPVRQQSSRVVPFAFRDV